ncbi:MAG: cysteine hydrolase [Candidatus Obscuribacterales bacterium]|nr:cysteine hydrolase [Candidatus Obscuribacterales bacterium]
MANISMDAVLLLIDLQKGFDSPVWGSRNNPGAEANIAKLLQYWRESGRQVIHVKHMSTEANSPLRPGQPGNDFKDDFAPLGDEVVFEKQVNSAFIGTKLDRHLRIEGTSTLVIAGLTTDHCVSTSTRMSSNLGFETYLVADACATFNRTGHDGKKYSADEVHALALASLHQEFATIMSTAQIVAACEKMEPALST